MSIGIILEWVLVYYTKLSGRMDIGSLIIRFVSISLKPVGSFPIRISRRNGRDVGMNGNILSVYFMVIGIEPL